MQVSVAAAEGRMSCQFVVGVSQPGERTGQGGLSEVWSVGVVVARLALPYPAGSADGERLRSAGIPAGPGCWVGSPNVWRARCRGLPCGLVVTAACSGSQPAVVCCTPPQRQVPGFPSFNRQPQQC